MVLSLRFPARDAERLRQEADARGTTISWLARKALAASLHPLALPPLSYGIADPPPGVSLSVSRSGVIAAEAQTLGCLSVERLEEGG